MSKFLVITKAPTPPMVAMDSPEAVRMMELVRSEFEYLLKLEKEGKIIAGGPFLDTRAGCFILNVESVEEMGEILFNSPMNVWSEREVHPLGSVADTLEGFKEMMKED
jgi:hypothetical protein